MRIRRNKLKQFFLRKRVVMKDAEGNTYPRYADAIEFTGESWPINGSIKVQQYGERLNYIRGLRVDGEYKMVPDERGGIGYDFGDGRVFKEHDGICIYTTDKPDYRIIFIKPYQPIRMEIERINHE